MSELSTNVCNVRVTGAIQDLSIEMRDLLFDRTTSNVATIRDQTAAIIAEVRREGDTALKRMAQSFDGVNLERLEVDRTVWRKALDRTAPELRRAMQRASDNIATVHQAFLPSPLETEPEPGICIVRRPDPLDSVGVYAPGGRAAYPSSVLMGAVPARVAGVRQVILCSPPGRDGLPSQSVLAAAELAEVDRLFAVGGGGAIAAMAYGTDSVPRVDRIVGPGNAYVAEAKLQLSGVVAIDSPAGPSELLIVTDGKTDPVVIAREVMAQAEHDPQASVVVVAIGEIVAQQIGAAISAMISLQARKEIVSEALATRGGLLWADDADEAIAFSNTFAPEHLLIAMRDAEIFLPRFRNAGTIFVGETSSVAYGDYMSGANHVLPTGGLARSYSGLSVLDFIRWTTYQIIDRDAAARLACDVGIFADAEGLPAHAAAARQWEGQR